MLDTAAVPMPLVLRAAPGGDRVLTPEALGFVAVLQARFGLRLHSLMVARARRQDRFDRGELPDFLPETTEIRQGVWEAGPVPECLRNRRVEIVGPVDPAALAAALDAGADAVVADFEDATSPGFAALVAGHAGLLDPATGPALLTVRPRGLHMAEANVLIGGQPVSAALFDVGLALFHSGRALAASGRGPFFCLPKLESHREARFWNEVFLFAQDRLGLPEGTIKATVPIETLPAAFEMDEIVWELRNHIAALACGRRGCVFSYIKTLRNHGAYILPDRDEVTTDRAFLAACAAQLVAVCRRRGIRALGGVAAAIPAGGDGQAGAAALAGVRADAQRQADLGHDGVRIAHPGLVPAARAAFAAAMPGPGPIRTPRPEARPEIRPEARIDAARLLAPHQGQVTERGIRANIAVAVECLAHWLQGRGTVPVGDRLENAATAEIGRAQLWQWRRHGASVVLADGSEGRLTDAWFGQLMQEEIVALLDRLGPGAFHRGHYASAARIVQEAVAADTLPDFITTPAYRVLNALG